MISIERKYDHQDLLNVEKEKANGTYLLEEIVDSLAEEFLNKCYLCEDNEITKINIDHFVPHKGDPEKKYLYENLYWCCAHCNGIKGGSEKELLDPITDNVEDKLNYFLKFKRGEKFESYVNIEDLSSSLKAKNTAELLEKIYNGTTDLGKYESKSLRKKIERVLVDLIEDIDILKRLNEKSEKEKVKRIINNKLSKESAFYGFKITLVKIATT